MAALSWLLALLLCLGSSMFLSADQLIRAEPGQTVLLPCGLYSRNPVLVAEWSRTDLGSDYVLLYRDEQIDPSNQHPSFMNRVDLKDRNMEDGDVSVVLKDVGTEDKGTYECRVVQSGTGGSMELITSIYLDVEAPPPPAGNQDEQKDGEGEDGGGEDGGGEDGRGKDGGDDMGLIVGIPVYLIIIITVSVGFLLYKKRKYLFKKNRRPSETEDQPLNAENHPED
ncbi:PREDICTED: uncharacterized protein LOC107101495 [Cyprinodon variegatus]|uniref:uncharacterized protein LOC107101495 n=1 Tax=Cyprinodon variegatus TaxID=28743 RepID=UPI0007426EBD|nr:PREDICTED: uncharacterized protein LOC107101495 [Cyprinodon variegatus]XP_015255931.1 PREDICTED: uncharacterized protein LOC107101495 [Cyprinodon variegatus]